MAWILIPCLKVLFAEFDAIAPHRDHASDGAVGDLAHQNEVSDHNPDETGNVPIHDADSINEVHAIDVDSTLDAPFTMEDVVQYLVSECRKNNPNGTDRGRLRYIIYNRRIWRAATGWKQETYTGASAHTEHAHFSAEYDTSFESDTSTWGLIARFGDDVSEQDVTNALNKFFNGTNMGDPPLPESRIGHDANVQRMPGAPFSDKQMMAYQYIGQIGTKTVENAQAIAELKTSIAELKTLIETHVSGLIEGK